MHISTCHPASKQFGFHGLLLLLLLLLNADTGAFYSGIAAVRTPLLLLLLGVYAAGVPRFPKVCCCCCCWECCCCVVVHAVNVVAVAALVRLLLLMQLILRLLLLCMMMWML